MFSFIGRHKFISGLILANIIAVIVAIAIVIIHHAKTATIDINVTPLAAEITLNGRLYANQESHDVLPGNYHVKISMDGMQTKEYEIQLDRDGYARIWDYLLDASGSFDYYLTHPDDEWILAQIAPEDDKAAQDFITSYDQKASLTDILPIEYAQYTNDYADYTKYNIDIDSETEDCNSILCLVIEDYTGGNEQIALAKIKELGYNPEDYKITYKYTPMSTSGEYNE